ncbi:unnamed protein product, partial [Vitis vinifera]|uniref:Uncharacterized protein n=1 Tax=Vitis vinifera TaxID=29760 RepID=D7SI02_VITVI
MTWFLSKFGFIYNYFTFENRHPFIIIFIVDFRPIRGVTYMQQNNLKMCLRNTNSAIDTSEVANAYGGGDSPSSSFFIIRMDEYNQWISMNSS